MGILDLSRTAIRCNSTIKSAILLHNGAQNNIICILCSFYLKFPIDSPEFLNIVARLHFLLTGELGPKF
ncbi:MAG: hypothetical protein ACXWFZ_12250 [Nitrososphaeraceae archaeon]